MDDVGRRFLIRSNYPRAHNRRNYRRFRVGKARGATGERPQETEGEEQEEERDAVCVCDGCDWTGVCFLKLWGP